MAIQHYPARINPDCEKPSLPGFVVLGRSPTDNAYKAVIELSFAMDLSADRCLFFWSSPDATSPLLNALVGKRVVIAVEGLKEAQHYQKHFSGRNQDMTFEIFDVHSKDLPIVIDWDEWRWAGEPADTLSGVRDKYRRRNPRFMMREA